MGLGLAIGRLYGSARGSRAVQKLQVPLSLYTLLAQLVGPLIGSTRLPMRSSRAEYRSAPQRS